LESSWSGNRDSTSNEPGEDSSSDDDATTAQSSEEIVLKSVRVSMSRNSIFKELITTQLRAVPARWRLNIGDIKRICKYIDTSIFSTDDCCLWNGYITNMNNTHKGTYVNFYFKKKKVALHRLLYSNYVSPLGINDYLKFSCENKGICCNVTHYKKYKYANTNKYVSERTGSLKNSFRDITIGGVDFDELTLTFD
jgi:hypothetical protein